MFIKNWAGLIYLTADPNGIQSLIKSLNQPIKPIMKRAIFNLFFDIFNFSGTNEYTVDSSNEQSINLLNTYKAMVLKAFIHCGIFDMLIMLSTNEEGEVASLVQYYAGK